MGTLIAQPISLDYFQCELYHINDTIKLLANTNGSFPKVLSLHLIKGARSLKISQKVCY